jgi:hypothetical protein
MFAVFSHSQGTVEQHYNRVTEQVLRSLEKHIIRFSRIEKVAAEEIHFSQEDADTNYNCNHN